MTKKPRWEIAVAVALRMSEIQSKLEKNLQTELDLASLVGGVCYPTKIRIIELSMGKIVPGCVKGIEHFSPQFDL